MNWRLFIAVDLSEEIRQEITGLQNFTKRYQTDTRWTEADDLHLTLSFLGDVDEAAVPALGESMDRQVLGTEIFSVHFAGFGFFPNKQAPSVIWIGVDDGVEALRDLACKVRRACRILNPPPKEERSFQPHLTIGRFKSSRNIQNLTAAVDGSSFRSSFSLKIDHIALKRSWLKPDRARYETKHVSHF